MTANASERKVPRRRLTFGLITVLFSLGLTASVAFAGLPTVSMAGKTQGNQPGSQAPAGGTGTTTAVLTTGTVTATLTVTGTATQMATMTRTATSVPTGTATQAATMTQTATAVATGTSTVAATGTATQMATMTRTATQVATATRTGTVGTPVATRTPCSGRVTICHRTGNGGMHTITVNCHAVPAHMQHGDTLGACPAGTPQARNNPFRDVNQGDYFYNPVYDLRDAGAITGYADGTFRPYNTATRSQFVKIVVLAFHMPLYEGNEQSFRDVPRNNPFYVYVETAQRSGLVGGYADGTFRPYANVTRGQVAKVAVEAARFEDMSTGYQSFSDVPVGSTFYKYIETAYANGILSGYADGTFRPNTNATRGQVTKMVDIATAPNE